MGDKLVRAGGWLAKGTARALLGLAEVGWWTATVAAFFVPYIGPFLAGGMALTYFVVRAIKRGFFPPHR